MAFFPLSFPIPLHYFHKTAWHISLFSFKRTNEDKKATAKWSRRGFACSDSWWLWVWRFPAACPIGCLLFPKRSNGELPCACSDTVKPSGMADYGAKYWSLPHTCQNSPHPLIRISPLCLTGTSRINLRTSWGGGECSEWGIIVTSCLASSLLSFEMTPNCLSNASSLCDNQTYFPHFITV